LKRTEIFIFYTHDKKIPAVYKILEQECQTCDPSVQSGTRNEFARHVCMLDVLPYTACSYKNSLRMSAVPELPHCSSYRKVTDFCYKSVTLMTDSRRFVVLEASKYFASKHQGIALLSKGGGKRSRCFKHSWLGRQCTLICLIYTWHLAPQGNTQIIYVNDFQYEIKICIKLPFVPRRIHLHSSLQRQSCYIVYKEHTNVWYKGSNNRGPTGKILQQL